jgi:hypothetical protein
VFSLPHQATGGCYASTVKPFQVALVKPVVYLKTELGFDKVINSSFLYSSEKV